MPDLLKTLLLFTPIACKEQAPVPPWMRAVLDARPHFRGSVHRSQYPEDPELQVAGALLARPPVARPVVVAMTTTPTRVQACEPAVRSLLNQSQPALIVVSIPDARRGVLASWSPRIIWQWHRSRVFGTARRSRPPRHRADAAAGLMSSPTQVYNKRRSHWNGKRIEPPAWLARLDAAARRRGAPCAPCVVIASPPHDYGPATKLVGAVAALRADPALLALAGGDDAAATIVAADDDHEWEPFALATLLHVGFSSSPTPPGYDAARSVWTYYSYPFPRGRNVRDPVCVPQAGDMLAAPLALFDELEAWGRELLPGGRLPSCFFVDDLFFAAYAAHHRATVYAHPWRRWLFREAKRRQRRGEAAIRPCARGGCSPKTMQLRYPDGLAMGPPRERHSANCQSELEALGWWTRGAEGDPCALGDFVSR